MVPGLGALAPGRLMRTPAIKTLGMSAAPKTVEPASLWITPEATLARPSPEIRTILPWFRSMRRVSCDSLNPYFLALRNTGTGGQLWTFQPEIRICWALTRIGRSGNTPSLVDQRANARRSVTLLASIARSTFKALWRAEHKRERVPRAKSSATTKLESFLDRFSDVAEVCAKRKSGKIASSETSRKRPLNREFRIVCGTQVGELRRANSSQEENTRSFHSGFSDGQGAKGTNHCDPEGLRRGIGQRQLGMIAIGGAIGTGLFFASGAAISQAGPGGALLAYSLMGLAVYCMMQSLGEMATQLPIPGAFEAYAERFIDPSLGFAFGWNYWFSWGITLAAEFVAGALIVQFWFPGTNTTVWAMGFFALLMTLNLLSVKAYAEAEYWFSGIKVVTVIIFIAVGALMIFGLLGGRAVGFQNWALTSPQTGLHAPFVGGLPAVLLVFLVAGFSFQGTEGVGLAAAETTDPGKCVPIAIRNVLWRILMFYIG